MDNWKIIHAPLQQFLSSWKQRHTVRAVGLGPGGAVQPFNGSGGAPAGPISQEDQDFKGLEISVLKWLSWTEVSAHREVP